MAFKMKGSAFKLNEVATKSTLKMRSPVKHEGRIVYDEEKRDKAPIPIPEFEGDVPLQMKSPMKDKQPNNPKHYTEKSDIDHGMRKHASKPPSPPEPIRESAAEKKFLKKKSQVKGKKSPMKDIQTFTTADMGPEGKMNAVLSHNELHEQRRVDDQHKPISREEKIGMDMKTQKSKYERKREQDPSLPEWDDSMFKDYTQDKHYEGTAPTQMKSPTKLDWGRLGKGIATGGLSEIF